MKREEIEKFCKGIATFAWNADFRKFCEVCNFDITTQNGEDYAVGKWQEWQSLQSSLKAFDLDRIEAIVNAGLVNESE
ncbi:hypothetical protein [Anabaena azotica]|uniref:Phage protein n=1 Tax=Anabaena azotica FACHB-119 TaxID=947527 RepID=A0ABR8DA38_9NOST|nr:hypothetical protein [Anabaena azotica]MBD2503964.1 hypothetical protein [Anabaena azotica FACHB-119]